MTVLGSIDHDPRDDRSCKADRLWVPNSHAASQ